jgi:hypothetical protein
MSMAVEVVTVMILLICLCSVFPNLEFTMITNIDLNAMHTRHEALGNRNQQREYLGSCNDSAGLLRRHMHIMKVGTLSFQEI